MDINGLGINMYKATLLAAVLLAAAFSATSNVAVAQTADQNPNTTKLVQDALNPYGATSKPAAPAKHARKHKAKKKKS